MKALVRGGMVAAIALTLTATTFAASAEARSSRRVIGGVAAGLVIGSLLYGASRAQARERVYVAPRASCGEYKRRAIWNEERGRNGTAAYWWDQYESCRGG